MIQTAAILWTINATTDGRDRSYQYPLWTRACNYQCQINIFNLFIKTGNDYSLSVICTESLLQLLYFRYLMLHVNLNRRNYKFNVHIYKISEDRYKAVKLHTCNLITVYILVILCSSYLIYLGMFRLTNMGIAVFVTHIHLKLSSNE